MLIVISRTASLSHAKTALRVTTCRCRTACFQSRHLKNIRVSIRCRALALANLPPVTDKPIPITWKQYWQKDLWFVWCVLHCTHIKMSINCHLVTTAVWATLLSFHEIVTFNSKLLTNKIHYCVLFTNWETSLKRIICRRVIANFHWLPPYQPELASGKMRLVSTHINPSCWKHLLKIRFSVLSDNTC